jgi:signal transduction histidine kinase
MVTAIAVAILSEMAFTLYTDVYGIANMAGHLFAVVSYYIMYRALIETVLKKPYTFLFRSLKQHEIALTNQTEDLTNVNEQLRREATERKKAEQALQQAQSKLEKYAKNLETIVEERTKQLKDAERLTAIGETAGMVGHDIRNPLQSIEGAIYLAKEEVESLPEGSEQRNELEGLLELIKEQLHYIDNMIADLQDFARRNTPQTKETDLQKLLVTSLSMVDVPKNIKVKNISRTNFKIDVDPEQSKRVFINLIKNAVQSMPNGGELTIRTLHDNENVLIDFEDTGVGIAEKNKPNMFKPLFTTKSKGQGFGLAVCKKLVEAQGGTITFQSEEGKGTTFTIKLPFSKKKS